MSKSGHTLLKQRPSRRMLLVLVLTAGYMVAEAIGGFLSNSLSLLADAGHMLADVAALVISLLAFLLSARPKNYRASFGYYRAEVIAALFNGVVLLLVAFFIIKEAYLRLFSPSEVETSLMMGIALGGLVVNVIGLSLLHKDKSHNLNIRGAWLHVFSDTLGSIGVIISGLLIYFFDFPLADPIASIAIACLVAYSALHLVTDTIRVLMEHAPAHINPQEVENSLLSLPQVVLVHDLHIWSITTGKDALSVHVVAQSEADYNKLLSEIQQMLATKFGIDHATIQIENECLVKDKTC